MLSKEEGEDGKIRIAKYYIGTYADHKVIYLRAYVIRFKPVHIVRFINKLSLSMSIDIDQ